MLSTNVRAGRPAVRSARRVLLLAVVLSCEPRQVSDPTTAVATVSVSPPTASVGVSASVLLSATARDAAGTVVSDQSFTWTTEAPGVAAVSSTGMVTGMSSGTATIRATASGQSGSATITVGGVPVASVQVSPPSASLLVSTTTQLTATPRDANNSVLTGRIVTWTTSNASRATVSPTGLVTAIAVGSATITATSEGRTGTAAITVTVVPVATVTVSPSSPSINVGANVQLSATLRDASNNILTGRSVTWSSSDPTKAQVTAGGQVNGMAAGSAAITATSEGQTGTATVTVTLAPVASVSVTPATSTVGVNSTRQLTATLRDANNNVLTGRPITWTSSDTNRAQVNTNGLVLGLGGGPVTITATSEGRSGTATVTVSAPVATVTVAPAAPSINVGASVQLGATLRDAANNVLTGRTITWTTSDPSKATVSTNGNVTGTGAGTATITATSEGQSGTATVTVTLVPVNSVTVTPNPATVAVGSTVTLTATLRDASNNILTGRTVTWTTSDNTKATVSNGVVSGVAAGSATITATSEGRTGTATVTVSLVAVNSVTVTPNPATVVVGLTVPLTATLRDAGGNILTGRTVTWSTSDNTKAQVSSAGVVTGVAAGSATITATSEGRTGTTVVTVTTTQVAAECATPQAGWIWCDDFEQDRLGDYFEYQNSGGRFTRVTGVGRNSSFGMRAQFVQGTDVAGSLNVTFGKSPSGFTPKADAGTAIYRDIYWRMYVRTQAGWQGGGGFKLSRATSFVSTNWAQSMIAHIWTPETAPDHNWLAIDPASGTDANGNVVTTTYNDFDNLEWIGFQRGTTALFDASHVGQWYCVEAHAKLNDAGSSNGIFEFWINDGLEARRTGLDFVATYSTYGINAVFFENYWNGGAPRNQERYFDNIVISTQRIGC